MKGAPVRYSQGLLTLPPTYSANLDEGALGPPREDDVWFSGETEPERALVSLNGATISVLPDDVTIEPTYCGQSLKELTVIPFKKVRKGSCFRVFTNRGRCSVFKVVIAGSNALTIRFTTWSVKTR